MEAAELSYSQTLDRKQKEKPKKEEKSVSSPLSGTAQFSNPTPTMTSKQTTVKKQKALTQEKSTVRSSAPNPYPFCGADHHPEGCKTKFNISPTEARDRIIRSQRCILCLGPHLTNDCRYPRSCAICSNEHHPSLCPHRPRIQQETQIATNVSHTATLQVNVPFTIHQTATVSARVEVLGPKSSMLVRCLLDSGSGRTYVTTSICEILKPKIIRYDYIGSHSFGGVSTEPTNVPVVELKLVSRHNESDSIVVEALVTPTISTCAFETAPIEAYTLPHLQDLKLADDPKFRNLNIGVLVGLDYYWRVVGSYIKRGAVSEPVAQSTIFGWVLSGNANPRRSDSSVLSLLTSTSQSPSKPPDVADLDASVHRLWELEGLGISSHEMNLSNHDLAYQTFLDSVQMIDQRYYVSLPWRPDHPPLLCNYLNASDRLSRLYRKLDKNPELYREYGIALDDFLSNSYVESVETDLHDYGFYMPHRPAIKTSSTTYKVRPVFDASANGSNGVSLNQCLFTGPSLISDVFDILLRLRQWRYGLIGDIERAFLQIRVNADDRDFLRYFDVFLSK